MLEFLDGAHTVAAETNESSEFRKTVYEILFKIRRQIT